MSRLLLAAVPSDVASAGQSGEAPADDPDQPPGAEQRVEQRVEQALARFARALRDAGHEVVHAGQGVDAAVVAAAAVQEDVDLVVLLAPPSYDVGALAAHLAGDAGTDGADDEDAVALVPVAADEQPARLVERVAGQVAGRVAGRPSDGVRSAVADDTPGRPRHGG